MQKWKKGEDPRLGFTIHVLFLFAVGVGATLLIMLPISLPVAMPILTHISHSFPIHYFFLCAEAQSQQRLSSPYSLV
ncbi:hypothetical protein PHAVU_008G045700 [Phaseolus vulgaris]|uniref:Uncharacterized protein n=1 Tax=Phaseolus vulgaris TaxID=3885 RepID=V7B237_PHAVU|nr:hypothetical protein PHAVU_008G045700g [Phaseolus vulgaris]ESW11620.1 hypothetical protein PHAVU_008G045700g [Phaseolus vulgaris]